MREFKKTMYETTDGKHFECYDEATEHEASLLENVDARSLAIALSDFCKSQPDCSDCPFSKKEVSTNINGGMVDCILRISAPSNWSLKI